MRKLLAIGVTFSLLLAWAGIALSGDDDGRAIVNKAIKAAGGEAKLAKFQSATFTEKGTYYGKGKGLPYTGVYAVKWPTHFKMEITGFFTIAIDGDKGWIKGEKGVQDLPKDQLAVELHNNKAGWITTLIPLKDKAFSIKTIDGGDKYNAVEVTRKDYPTVKLYFDKKTNLLAKSEFKTKAQEQEFKEVTQEAVYSDYRDVEGAKQPYHLLIKQDGKTYVESDMIEMKSTTFDAKAFTKPASN